MHEPHNVPDTVSALDWRRKHFSLEVGPNQCPQAPGHLSILVTTGGHRLHGIKDLIPEEVLPVVAALVKHLLTLGDPGVALACRIADNIDQQITERMLAELPEASAARHAAAK